jgi:hypothetical protein
MGGGTFTILHTHSPRRIAHGSYSTHLPHYHEEGSHDYHPLHSARLHHDALLQIFDRQRSSVFLHWNRGITEFPRRICHQRSEQKRVAYFVG